MFTSRAIGGDPRGAFEDAFKRSKELRSYANDDYIPGLAPWSLLFVLINIFNFILFNYTEVYCFRRPDAFLFSPYSFFCVKLRTKPRVSPGGTGRKKCSFINYS